MNNRVALVGAVIVAMSAACPSVAAAQNPWRTQPQNGGQYMTPPAPTPTPQPLPKTPAAPTQTMPNMDNYAPLDGKIVSEAERQSGYRGGFPGAYQGGYPRAYPGSPYGGPGYGGYGGTPYLGGLGYPGLGGGGYSPYNGLGSPYGGSGLWPGLGGLNNNGLGGPMAWSPFW